MATLAVAAIIQIGVTLAINALQDDVELESVGARIGDLSVSGSELGAPLPIVYGTSRLPGNLEWASPKEEVEVVSTQSTGGKGGGPQTNSTTTTFEYFGSFLYILAGRPCDGDGLIKIFFGGDLVYDATVDDSGDVTSPSLWKYGAEAPLPVLLDGNELQLPPALIEQFEGVGNVSGYRGVTGILFERLPLRDFGNRVPPVSAVIAYDAAVAFPQVLVQSAGAANTTDAAFDSQRRILWTCSSVDKTVQAFDLNNNTRIGIFDFDTDTSAPIVAAVPKALAIDPGSGKCFVFATNPVVESYMCAFEPTNIALVAISTELNPGTSGYVAGTMAVTSLGLLPPAVAIIGGTGLGRVEVTLFDDDVFESGKTFTPVFGQSCYSVVVDRNGVFWMNASSLGIGGDTRIYRVEVFSEILSGLDAGLREFLLPTAFKDQRLSTYDPVGHNIIMGEFTNSTEIHKLSLDTLQVVDTFGSGDQNLIPHHFAFRDSGASGAVIIGGTADLQFLRISDFTITEGSPYDTSDWAGGFMDVYYFDAISNSNLGQKDSDDLRLDFLNRVDIAGVELQGIVEDICERCGLDPSEILASALAGTTVRGYPIRDEGASGASSLKPLLTAFDFDVYDPPAGLTFVQRPGSLSETIDVDDLGAEEGKGLLIPYEEKTKQSKELPIQIDVKYFDPEREYQSGDQSERRQITPFRTQQSESRISIGLGVVFSDDEARQIAQRVMYRLHNERRTFSVQLPTKYVGIEPTDVIDLPIDGIDVRCRVSEVFYGANGIVSIKAVVQEDSVFTSVVEGAPGSPPVQTVPLPISVEGWLLDLPLLRDGDDRRTSGMSTLYFAVSSLSAGFQGAILQRSPDGVSFGDFGSSSATAAYGFISPGSELADTEFYGTWDRELSITVLWQVGIARISTVTEDQVLEGQNAFLIGREVIQAATIVDNGDGTLTLSDILRGRRGTSAFTASHTVSAEIVLYLPIVEPDIRLGSVPLDDIGTNRTYLLTAFGAVEGREINHVHVGNSLKPYQVYSVKAEEDAPTSGDLTISWLRRVRTGGTIGWNALAVPLSESIEEYDLLVLDAEADADADAVRSFAPADITVSSSQIADGYSGQVVYTSAQRSTDSKTGAVVFRIYQRSALVGRGFAKNQTSTDLNVAV